MYFPSVLLTHNSLGANSDTTSPLLDKNNSTQLPIVKEVDYCGFSQPNGKSNSL